VSTGSPVDCDLCSEGHHVLDDNNTCRCCGVLRITDKLALDAIATAMSCEEWNADLWEIVSVLVQQTGRVISDNTEYDDEPEPPKYPEPPIDLGDPRYGR
jgi:hypothetical protein